MHQHSAVCVCVFNCINSHGYIISSPLLVGLCVCVRSRERPFCLWDDGLQLCFSLIGSIHSLSSLMALFGPFAVLLWTQTLPLPSQDTHTRACRGARTHTGTHIHTGMHTHRHCRGRHMHACTRADRHTQTEVVPTRHWSKQFSTLTPKWLWLGFVEVKVIPDLCPVRD